MAAQPKKFLDVDVISFLEAEMNRNTEHYKSDFEIDKIVFSEAVQGIRKEANSLLWLSRPNGTYCCKEHEAFIKDTAAHNTWCYYADDRVVAYAVEISGIKDGVVRGNVFELDYPAHVAEVAEKAVDASVYQKTFEDGFVVEVEPERSSFGFFYELVNEHGKITDSLAIPCDSLEHKAILNNQKKARDRLKPAELDGAKKPSLESRIKYAAAKGPASGLSDKKVLGHEFAR